MKVSAVNMPYGLQANFYTLPNGQRVVVVPKEGPTVVKTYVNSGSMNESDRVRGISHYIEHNLFNGSKGLENGDFFQRVDKMGADTNASTDFAKTDYYISSNLLNETDFENQVKMHASMLESPLFTQEKLDKEKGIVSSEINMILSNPRAIAENTTIKNLYGIKSTSTDLVAGTVENINNITREDVVDYYNNNYYPENMTTVITGEVAPEQAVALASKYFTSTRKAPQTRYQEELKPIQQTVREDIKSDKATGTTIMIGFNGPANNNGKEKVLTDALDMLLSGPAGRIRGRLKQYSALPDVGDYKISTKATDGRALLVAATTTEQNCDAALKAIWDEIYGVQINPPTAEEMQIIKKNLIKDYSKALEVSSAANSLIGESLLDNDFEYLANYEQIVNNMTGADIVTAAKKYMDLNKAAVTVVHPAAKSNGPVSFTGKQVVNPANVKEYQFPNNIRLIMNEIPTNNAYISASFKCDTPIKANPAAYEILNLMLGEGTAAKDETLFKSELGKNAIGLSVSANDQGIMAEVDFDCADTVSAMQALKEVLYTPRFDEQVFTKAKNNMRNMLMMTEKSAADKLVSELFKGMYAGIGKDEIIANLDSLKLQDVVNLHAALISGARGKIAISAPKEMFRPLCAEIGTMKQVKEPKYVFNENFTPVEQTKVLTDTHAKPQAQIIQAYKFRTNDNIKDKVAMRLLNIILGDGPSSRLFGDLREQQKLAYNVGSERVRYDATTAIQLFIKTTTENTDTGEVSYDNVQKAINGFNKHINLLKTEKVSEEELQNAKTNLKNKLLGGTETAYGKTESLIFGAQTPYGPQLDNKLIETIDTITTDDIYNAANYIFAGKPVYSIVATENTLKHNAEFLDKLSDAI